MRTASETVKSLVAWISGESGGLVWVIWEVSGDYFPSAARFFWMKAMW
jgi:hypothetical protein